MPDLKPSVRCGRPHPYQVKLQDFYHGFGHGKSLFFIDHHLQRFIFEFADTGGKRNVNTACYDYFVCFYCKDRPSPCLGHGKIHFRTGPVLALSPALCAGRFAGRIQLIVAADPDRGTPFRRRLQQGVKWSES